METCHTCSKKVFVCVCVYVCMFVCVFLIGRLIAKEKTMSILGVTQSFKFKVSRVN